MENQLVTEVPKTKSRVGNYRWTICSLVFFATTINYLDRQVISLLKPILEKEFSWTESDYSNIVIAFQLAYAIGMLGIGRIIDKIGSKLGYALSLLLWSIASILHAFATSTLSFGVYRALLGVTESGNFPAAIKTVAEWFPRKERALATGIFNSGTNVGAIAAPVVVPWLAVNWGWQMAFIVTGAVGLLWLVFWFIMYEVPAKHKRLSEAEYNYIHTEDEKHAESIQEEGPTVSWTKLLTYKQTWSFILGKFLTDGIWWFFLFWLPAFLIAEYGLGGMQISFPIAVVYTMTCFGSVLGGFLPMWFVKNKGWNIVRARKTSMFIYALFPVLVVFSQQAGSYNMWYAVIIIGIAASAHQAWSANIFTTVSDMFPKKSVGSVIGMGGMAGGAGGMVMAKLAGILFDHYKSLGHIQTGYYIMFVICGASYLIAWFVMFGLLVPKMTPIKAQ
ncbi:MFS transporter [Desertivirga xinjiangensis]|uniref:MFS transporter n=1 Tax=Desertivirga xinjiangensis TaxID=539206 RepID=UPI00210D6A25|nr:MFS transporter [Pedobacter xinjiangensis]